MSTEDTLLRTQEQLWQCMVSLNWLGLQLMNPPEGWYTFGSHVDSDVELEFWGYDEGGLPLWERPVQYR